MPCMTFTATAILFSCHWGIGVRFLGIDLLLLFEWSCRILGLKVESGYQRYGGLLVQARGRTGCYAVTSVGLYWVITSIA